MTLSSYCWRSKLPSFPQLLLTYATFCLRDSLSCINQLHHMIYSGFFTSHLSKSMNGIRLPLRNIFPVKISNNLTPHFWWNTLYFAQHAGKSLTSLYYVEIQGLSYLHVKFQHAVGIFTIGCPIKSWQLIFKQCLKWFLLNFIINNAYTKQLDSQGCNVQLLEIVKIQNQMSIKFLYILKKKFQKFFMQKRKFFAYSGTVLLHISFKISIPKIFFDLLF